MTFLHSGAIRRTSPARSIVQQQRPHPVSAAQGCVQVLRAPATPSHSSDKSWRPELLLSPSAGPPKITAAWKSLNVPNTDSRSSIQEKTPVVEIPQLGPRGWGAFHPDPPERKRGPYLSPGWSLPKLRFLLWGQRISRLPEGGGGGSSTEPLHFQRKQPSLLKVFRSDWKRQAKLTIISNN